MIQTLPIEKDVVSVSCRLVQIDGTILEVSEFLPIEKNSFTKRSS